MRSGKVIDLRAGKRASPEPQTRRLAAPAPHNRDRRVSPIRVRRRKVRAYIALAAVVLLALVVYGVHWVSYLPRLAVREITIEGANQLDPQLIRSYTESVIDDGSFHFLSRSNIFLYPKAIVEKGIVDSFPRVRAASVARNGLLGQTLTVTVDERAPFALWCRALDQNDCFAMDDQGFIFTEAASSTDSVRFEQPYIFSGGVASDTVSVIGRTFAPGHVPGILALLRLLGQSADLTPMSVTVSDDQDFFVTFAQGFILKASYGESPSTLSRNIHLVLGSDALVGKESQLEYVDLRFGNRVYYKLKGEDQASTQ
ncbi:MAG: hypothetical protein JWM46_432 [Candidatus Kaiserbacteria bacterium]|nr:hypothetical protein [Candidatus Kaiserbacteria bacterium]